MRFQLQTVCCNKVTQAFHAQTKHSFLEAYQRGKDLKCNIAALSCFFTAIMDEYVVQWSSCPLVQVSSCSRPYKAGDLGSCMHGCA